MENLPLYISLVFALTTGLTVFLFYKASNKSGGFLAIIMIWLGLQTVLSLHGFYLDTKTVLPRFLLTILPPLLLIILLFSTAKGRAFTDGLQLKALTILHLVRIPVELVLFWLFLHRAVPGLMTFEGRNFDVISGLTAPVLFYFVFIKKTAGRKALLLWNFVCLGLLINIVVLAILSAPFTFQKLAFDQPNIALLYFPFIWLPSCIVPLVLLSHLSAIRQLLKANPKVTKAVMSQPDTNL